MFPLKSNLRKDRNKKWFAASILGYKKNQEIKFVACLGHRKIRSHLFRFCTKKKTRKAFSSQHPVGWPVCRQVRTLNKQCFVAGEALSYTPPIFKTLLSYSPGPYCSHIRGQDVRGISYCCAALRAR